MEFAIDLCQDIQMALSIEKLDPNTYFSSYARSANDKIEFAGFETAMKELHITYHLD